MASPALAQVLSGAVDPSGRLPVTMPATSDQTPAATTAQFPGHGGTVAFGGLSDLGYRWYQANQVAPAYPFGFGLSYTHFAWSQIHVARVATGATVSVRVTNTGARPGVDVVQVYVSYPSGLGEPLSQLRGFARVDLAPGASKDVTISLARSAFTYYNGRDTVVAQGSYGINVGTSSQHFVASALLSF
jgi:beta-glucosidase